MKIEDATPGSAVILSRRTVDLFAPAGSTGYGEQILATVVSRCNGDNRGLVRIRFRDPFVLGDNGQPVGREEIVDPEVIKPVTAETLRESMR